MVRLYDWSRYPNSCQYVYCNHSLVLTFSVTRSLVGSSLTGIVVLCVGSYDVYTGAEFELNNYSLAVLFVLLIYPTAVLIACSVQVER